MRFAKKSVVTVRPARPEDAPALAALANALDRDQGGSADVHSPDTILKHGFGGDAAVRFIVAERDGAAVGYAMFSAFYNSDTAQTGSYLNDLYVVPELQRTGTGRRLLAAVAAETEKRAGTFVWTGVYTANIAARVFYEKAGARDEDARLLEIDGENFRALARDAED